MTFGCAVRVEDGIDIGAIIRTQLAKHEVQHKAIWLECEMDGASFSRALCGEQPLDLWRLRKLAARYPKLLVDILTSFAIAVVHQYFNDIQMPLRMARAVEPTVRKDRVS